MPDIAASATATHPWEYSAFPARVAGKRRISPGFIRVTLHGPALRHFAPWGLDQRIKLVLPMPGGTLAEFGLLRQPTPHPREWYTRWKQLDPAERNELRTYTPSAIRAERSEIDVDVFVHEPAGPASSWALDCEPGDELVLTGPDARVGYTGYGIHFTPPDAVRRLLLVGDESALPAIANIVAAHPDATIDVLLDLADPADNILPPSPNSSIVVAARPDGLGTGLLDEISRWGARHHELVARSTGVYAWIAGETDTTAAARRLLTGTLGLAKERVAFLGYWRRGGPLVG